MVNGLTPHLFRLSGIVGAARAGVAPFVPANTPIVSVRHVLSGVSRDLTGNALAGCTVSLFRVDSTGATPRFTHVDTAISDGSGAFSFIVGSDGPFRATYDLDGAPIRAALTLMTLAGVSA